VLRDVVGCDSPVDPVTDRTPASTAGIGAYVDGEPAGWAAVDARSAFCRLHGSPVPWAGRHEDKDETSV